MATIGDVIREITKEEKYVLKKIYEMRCLSKKQIIEVFDIQGELDNANILNTVEDSLNKFLKDEVIEEVAYADLPEVYFLTTLGINVVRYVYNLPTNIYDSKKRVVKRGYYRAGELKMAAKNINHQLHLNQFVIDFLKENKNVSWKYEDEKHMETFTNIRPDGLITIYDTYFFIETDMNTESKKQLADKWQNYRRFLNSREYFYLERKVVVLFVIENTNNPQNRIDLVKHTVFENIIDMFDAHFEMYVDTRENLLKIMNDKIIPSVRDEYSKKDKMKKQFIKNGFKVTEGELIKTYLHDTEYDYYVRKVDKNGNIVVENGKLQEFLVAEFFDKPVSTLNKIAYLDFNNSHFSEVFNRNISLIVIGDNEEEIYRDLKIGGLLGTRSIYFTTLERLETKPFYLALFQIDFLGNVHSFKNSGLNETVFETRLEKFKE
jgi:hypothetical protein